MPWLSFFTPLLGTLSDRYERKPVLIASLCIEVFSFALSALANSLPLLLLARLRRGLPHDPWRETLSVASSGPGRECAGYPGAEPAQHASSETVFSETAQGLARRATRDHQWETTNLWEQPNASSCLAWNIDSTKAETIERKTPTNPHDCVRRRCDASRQPAQAQRFLSAIGPITGHFQRRRHRLRAGEYHAMLLGQFQQWNEVTGVQQIA
jgi:hypothetical protein